MQQFGFDFEIKKSDLESDILISVIRYCDWGDFNRY